LVFNSILSKKDCFDSKLEFDEQMKENNDKEITKILNDEDEETEIVI